MFNKEDIAMVMLKKKRVAINTAIPCVMMVDTALSEYCIQTATHYGWSATVRNHFSCP